MPKLIKFPHINQFRHVVEEVRKRAEHHATDLPALKFRGTVKLHGTNAAVCRDMKTGETWAQSRESIITPEADNSGFARFAAEKASALNVLFNLYGQYFTDGTLSIYGEWCGKGIMKGVGVNKLDKMFVIFGVRYRPEVNSLPWIDVTKELPASGRLVMGRNAEFEMWEERWDTDEPLGSMTHWVPIAETEGKWLDSSFSRLINGTVTLHAIESNGIFDIQSFPTFEVTIDFKNPDASVEYLTYETTRVEASCPVTFSFGQEGLGEGIVWTCVEPWLYGGGKISSHDLRFKTKGDKHKESAHEKPTADPAKISSIAKFVESVLTEHRLEKMVEKLAQRGIQFRMENTIEFIKVVGEDVVREEGDVMAASGLNRKEVMGAVGKAASAWWKTFVADQPL